MSCKNASGKIQISCSMGPPAPPCLLTTPIGFSGNARVLVRLPSILLSASRQHSPYSPAYKIRPIGFSGNVLSRSLLEPEGGQRSDTELSAMGKRTQPTQTSQQPCLSVTYPPFPFLCPLPMSSCPYVHVFHVLPRCCCCRTLNMDTRHMGLTRLAVWTLLYLLDTFGVCASL